MGKKLHLDPLAEREANDVGEKFMHSRDVVGDMSRAYGRDLSSVQIHTDESAARRAKERGVDAFSTGRDVFFAHGAFDQNDPASRGLLAHELSHSLQQGVGGAPAMAQAAPMGAEQGGFLDWFRGLFGRRKKPELDISEPTLVTGPFSKKMINDTGDETVRSFQNPRSYAIHQMVQNASREQLQDPALRKLVIEDYNTSMNSRLLAMNNSTKSDMDGQAFRRGAGELSTMNTMLSSMLPEDFSTQVMAAQKSGGTDSAMDFISDSVEANGDVMNFIGALAPSFEGVKNYADPAERSAIMMNNLVLRNVNGAIGKRVGMAERARTAELEGQGKSQDEIYDDLKRTVDKSDIKRSMQLQRELNVGKSASAGRLRSLFTNLLRGRSRA